MNLREYMDKYGVEATANMAKRAGSTLAYMYQIAGNHRLPGAGMCRKIQKASYGRIKPADLRPDFFGP